MTALRTFENTSFEIRLSNDQRRTYDPGSSLRIDELGDITVTDPTGLEWQVPRDRWLDISLDSDCVLTNRWHSRHARRPGR